MIMTVISSDAIADVLREVYDDTYSVEGAVAINSVVYAIAGRLSGIDSGFDICRFQQLCGM
jgi:hypothetical protein